MEFRFNLNEIFRRPIVEIDASLIPPGFAGDRRALWDAVTKVTEIVNSVGEASAAAQGLTKPITTADRLRNSEQRVYLLIDKDGRNGKGAVSGMLKTGKKGLYVFDRDGHHYQVQPPCVLDFYIHESRQRTGLGKHLFEHMLEKEKIEPVKMAIDRPSDKFLSFLNKHYQLDNAVKQMNNFVVFDGFFPEAAVAPESQEKIPEGNECNTPVRTKQSANGLQSNFSSYGRYGAPRPPCSMGQIIHNQSSVIPQSHEPTGVSLNIRDPRSRPLSRTVSAAQPQQNNAQNYSKVTQSAPNMGNTPQNLQYYDTPTQGVTYGQPSNMQVAGEGQVAGYYSQNNVEAEQQYSQNNVEAEQQYSQYLPPQQNLQNYYQTAEGQNMQQYIQNMTHSQPHLAQSQIYQQDDPTQRQYQYTYPETEQPTQMTQQYYENDLQPQASQVDRNVAYAHPSASYVPPQPTYNTHPGAPNIHQHVAQSVPIMQTDRHAQPVQRQVAYPTSAQNIPQEGRNVPQGMPQVGHNVPYGVPQGIPQSMSQVGQNMPHGTAEVSQRMPQGVHSMSEVAQNIPQGMPHGMAEMSQRMPQGVHSMSQVGQNIPQGMSHAGHNMPHGMAEAPQGMHQAGHSMSEVAQNMSQGMPQQIAHNVPQGMSQENINYSHQNLHQAQSAPSTDYQYYDSSARKMQTHARQPMTVTSASHTAHSPRHVQQFARDPNASGDMRVGKKPSEYLLEYPPQEPHMRGVVAGDARTANSVSGETTRPSAGYLQSASKTPSQINPASTQGQGQQYSGPQIASQ